MALYYGMHSIHFYTGSDDLNDRQLAAMAAYPLDTIRRRMMMTSGTSVRLLFVNLLRNLIC